MKKEPKERKPLVLRRETLRVIDEDALHQARGGRAGSTSKAELAL